MSHPARGGWIEINLKAEMVRRGMSHPARGGWIEIEFWGLPESLHPSPTPHGVGGLKYRRRPILAGANLVPPRTGWVD